MADNPTTDRGLVWVVEDSALEAEMARRALQQSQEIEVFSDGAVLLERIASGAIPDALVLDIQMPSISGIEICRALRRDYDQMALPVLMLTVHDRKHEVVEALRAGANDYVTKPYDVAELVARVGTLVRTSHLQRAQARRQRQIALAADVGAAMTKQGGYQASALRCCEAIARHTHATAVEIWAHANGSPDAALARLASTNPDHATLPVEIVNQIAEGRAPLVDDVGCVIVLPLFVREDPLGALVVKTRTPALETENSLRTIVDLLALGLSRARIEEDRASLLVRERNSRADAEAANRSKDEFLAMVSHELRTPLNAITGWVSMLLSGNLAPDRHRRALETIDRSARTQAQLIDDLLDISRIVSGNLRLEVGAVDVASITDLAIESVRLAAETKGVKLESDIDRRAGLVSGDAERLQQMIWNVLSNAIKFTPAGGTVTIRARRAGERVEIEVQDTGQGIDPAFLPHVFERFKQADGTMTRAKGGLGLGLAIVRHLLELHGGTIAVDSEGLGKGARFLLSIPAQQITTSIATPGDAILTRSNGSNGNGRTTLDRPREIEGLRVLIVDDEPDARDMLRMLLESCRVVVRVVANASEAFAAIKEGSLDVVLSDIAMPGEDGFSLIRRVRQLSREEGGRVPAVALTAYARLEDRTRALRAGFNSHVAKPVEPSELFAVLASLTAT